MPYADLMQKHGVSSYIGYCRRNRTRMDRLESFKRWQASRILELQYEIAGVLGEFGWAFRDELRTENFGAYMANKLESEKRAQQAAEQQAAEASANG